MNAAGDGRAGRLALTVRIQDRVDDLTRPSTTREHQAVWNETKSRFDYRPHVLEHPSLLVQLERAVTGTTGPAGSAGSFESKPVARIDALDTLEAITRESARLVGYVLHQRPSTTPANLHLLAARSHDLADPELRDLDFEVLCWWARARVTTGWDSPAWKPHVRCMSCDRLGTLRVRVAPLAAACLACGAAWDASTIGILGEHIRIALAEPIDQVDTREEAG